LDSQTLGIGVFLGVVVGALVIGLFFRARLAATERRARKLRRENDELRRHAAQQTAEMLALVNVALRTLDKASGDARSAVSGHADLQSRLSGELQRLAVRAGAAGADAEADAVEVQAAQHATEELAARERALEAALVELERRFDIAQAMVQAAADDDRMTAHKIDDLVGAAAEAVGVSSTMDDVIQRIKDAATQTAELSAEVSTQAERGYRAVHRTLDEIERIRGLTDTARERIEALGERVAGIGHVVKVIHEITEKTNLLALNASIIAAQAGEHGRSFAVVANEIKALAQRTAASTKEISEQIRGVQDESARASSAMVDGVAAVGEGFQVAISAGDALDAIRQSAKAAQKKVQHMTRTLRQQSNVAQQVVDSAAQVSERSTSFATAVRGQTSMADRMRGAALDLDAGAREIAELVRSQGSSTALCVDTVQRLSDRMTLLRRRELELRRAMREIESGAGTSLRFGDEMSARWAAVEEALGTLQRVTDLRA